MPMGINAVRAALETGDCVMVTIINEPDSKAGTFFALKGSGKTVSKNVFAKLRDDLIPADAGLFDDAPQSFILKPEA